MNEKAIVKLGHWVNSPGTGEIIKRKFFTPSFIGHNNNAAGKWSFY